MLVEMFIKGLMIDPVTSMPIVILRDADNQRTLPIWVGPVEANAIALQIENVSPARPAIDGGIGMKRGRTSGTFTRANFVVPWSSTTTAKLLLRLEM